MHRVLYVEILDGCCKLLVMCFNNFQALNIPSKRFIIATPEMQNEIDSNLGDNFHDD